MAKEAKYDVVIDSIPDGEPIMLFRAKDLAMPAMLECYATICEQLGSPTQHVDHVRAIKQKVLDFQRTNRDVVKAPD